MQSSFSTERGAESLNNMFGLIRYEAHCLGLTSKQTNSAIFVFPEASFPDIHGIKRIDLTSVALYTKIEEEGECGPFVVNLWALELMKMVPTYKKDVCPFTRYTNMERYTNKMFLRFTLL